MIGKGRGTIGPRRAAGSTHPLIASPHHFFASRLFSDWLLVNHHFRRGLRTTTTLTPRFMLVGLFVHPFLLVRWFMVPPGPFTRSWSPGTANIVIPWRICRGSPVMLTGLVKTAHQLASYFTSSLRIDSSSFRRFGVVLG
jgi:hypothetical protein